MFCFLFLQPRMTGIISRRAEAQNVVYRPSGTAAALFQRIRQVPVVSHAPNAHMMMRSHCFSAPDLFSSSSSIGTLDDEVFPYFEMLVGIFSVGCRSFLRADSIMRRLAWCST